MRKTTTLAAALAAAFTAMPAEAADYPLPRREALEKYSGLWHAVHDEREGSAGRNVRRWRVRTESGRLRPASAREVAQSTRRLRTLLVLLRADRRLAHFDVRTGDPKYPAASRVPTGYGGGSPTLRAIAQCESGGNPRAVSPSGAYRGLLQFDQKTWESVGGSGDPAAASAAEQYHRGAILYARRGAAPWPVCGR